MKRLAFGVGFIVFVANANAQIITRKNVGGQKKRSFITRIDFSKLIPIELPPPNAEPSCYQGAGRKNEIYNMQLTGKYFGWTNPTSGCAVHINNRDEIEVYHFALGISQGVTDSAVNYIEAHKDTVVIITNPRDLRYYAGGIGFGKPASVLITSEISLDRSEAIKMIMQELWVHGIQIYYLRNLENTPAKNQF